MAFQRCNDIMFSNRSVAAFGHQTDNSRAPIQARPGTSYAEPSISKRKFFELKHVQKLSPGSRPSVLGGCHVASTGTASIDSILVHRGLPCGSSLLIEENGTTDNAGAILRCFAAEGLLQGHTLWVVGAGKEWVKQLPGVAGNDAGRKGKKEANKDDKMKIAWRYEGQEGNFRDFVCTPESRTRRLLRKYIPAFPLRKRSANSNPAPAPAAAQGRMPSVAPTDSSEAPPPFCHTFDLTKRLEIPANSKIKYLPISFRKDGRGPFAGIIETFHKQKASGLSNSPHRIVIPSFLSPATYPQAASHPEHVVTLFQSLRSLLRMEGDETTIMVSLPLSLYSRNDGLIRWLEVMVDGTLELEPFPHSSDDDEALGISGAATRNEEKPHGMLHIHKLPLIHEQGSEHGRHSAKALGDNLAFTVSRREFKVGPFHLPPADGDQEAQKEADKAAKDKLEF